MFIMKDFIDIGIIVKPQGVKGELKVRPFARDKSRFKTLKEVYIDGISFKVKSARICEDFCIISLENVFDRNVAETLRNKTLSVKFCDAVKLQKNEYFVDDLIGLTVKKQSGETVGEIIEVTEAKTDYITIKNKENKELRFPFLKDVIFNIDLENKTFTVIDNRFEEICVYED